ncbi:MAG: DUF1080 domain-containing protein [Verrucomicrobiaceae bacterium]|nr:DUF1080 domain-containing protein [Verrucomicrobiaceae bacterium]
MLALVQCGRKTESKREWRLLDAPHAASWRASGMDEQGKAFVKDGEITTGIGAPMTGITFIAWESLGVPRDRYIIEYEAMRAEGADFFGSITFPVRDSGLTFIIGGWGGRLTGVSSIDGLDASENMTRGNFAFENNRWYRVRIELKDENLTITIDGRPFVNVSLKGRETGLRYGEISKCLPLGFASYFTTARIRHVVVREL